MPGGTGNAGNHAAGDTRQRERAETLVRYPGVSAIDPGAGQDRCVHADEQAEGNNPKKRG